MRNPGDTQAEFNRSFRASAGIRRSQGASVIIYSILLFLALFSSGRAFEKIFG
jgi:hypothetical protein